MADILPGSGLQRRPHGSGDAWVEGPDGRRFWGTFGAAGLLVADLRRGVLLQHRAEWSHFGGTWGLPGGARHEAESAVDGALREAAEEAGVPADAVTPAFASVLDLGWWSYSTVVAIAHEPFDPVISDAESIALRWVPVDEVPALPLHPGFADAWPSLRPELFREIVVVVDAANVVGSRPDGWWRDRPGATARLVDRLTALHVAGWPAELLGLPHTTWWPRVEVVIEGEAKRMPDPAPRADLAVLRADTDGDSAVVARVTALAAAATPPTVIVVTSDRALATRVTQAGARVVTPGALLRALGV